MAAADAFATPAQYRAKYDSAMDDGRLAEWLADASSRMRAAMDAAGVDYSDPDEAQASALAGVCRDMVHRAIGDAGAGGSQLPGVPFGATQYSLGVGDHTANASFANPYGDLFLTKAEKSVLGIGRARAGFCSPFGGGSDA